MARFKARGLESKNAGGVIIINAPGAKGVDGDKLNRSNSSRPSRKLPVFNVTTSIGKKIAAASGKSLMDLRRLADAGPCMLPLKAKVAIDATVVHVPKCASTIEDREDLAHTIRVVARASGNLLLESVSHVL